MDYTQLVKVPDYASINSGISACKQDTVLAIFGKPGKMSKDCSTPTSKKLLEGLVTEDVGPFKVTGLNKIVALLRDIFKEIKEKEKELYDVLDTAGMLCCRAVRGSSTYYSNHSFGSAIDLKIKGALDKVGDGKCQYGLLACYHYFYKRGFYWGSEFGKNNASREDSMHFEASDELMKYLYLNGPKPYPLTRTEIIEEEKEEPESQLIYPIDGLYNDQNIEAIIIKGKAWIQATSIPNSEVTLTMTGDKKILKIVTE